MLHNRWLAALLVLVPLAAATPAAATSFAVAAPAAAAAAPVVRMLAARLDAGGSHTCAILDGGAVRCWGSGVRGELGYGNTRSIGDDEAPSTAGPVDLGPGPATAVAVGGSHTCALVSGQVRCWGSGQFGQLGQGNTDNIGDDETPGSVPPVDLGPGRYVTAIAAGTSHTCALTGDGAVFCWGSGASGRLGYGNTRSVGDDESPGSAGPVDLGAGRTATAITAGTAHTCALLDDGSVRCWGLGTRGRLGSGNTATIGDNETPGSAPAVFLGRGRRAVAISAGGANTCAVLDTGQVRCWGAGDSGQVGSGSRADIGDDETPGSTPVVDVGAGRTVRSVSTGAMHSCAVLDNGAVRCWGLGENGRLGLDSTRTVGDDERPGSLPPVNLGARRTATAITAGFDQTCAALDNGYLRCWGHGSDGQLGYGSTADVGDDERPADLPPLQVGALVTQAATSPPFLTLLFSRLQTSTAEDCQPAPGAVDLVGQVAPELADRGLTGTMSIVTGTLAEHGSTCTDDVRSDGTVIQPDAVLYGSWDTAAQLRDSYGWSAVSHSETYRAMDTLSADQQEQESCGSLAALRDHGHDRANGLFAYPNNRWTTAIQRDVVSACFAFGRTYGPRASTRSGTKAPWFQQTLSLNGGRCSDTSAPCSGQSSAYVYTQPADVVAAMSGLRTNSWFVLQAYRLVTGALDGRWDCTSDDPAGHWTQSTEDYCYTDYLTMLDAVNADTVVTDPLTVAQAWGRG